MSIFDISVNGGAAQKLSVETTQYIAAAVAVPALLGIEDYPVRVKIWVDAVVADYPPLHFEIDRSGGEARQIVQRYDGERILVRP